MRPFEILILTTSLIDILLGLFGLRARLRWAVYLPSLGVLFTIIHLTFEGYRWQMIPAYALISVLLLLALRRLLAPEAAFAVEGHRLFKTTMGVAGLLCLAVAAFLPAVFPIPRTLDLTGLFAVGTVTYHLVDETRAETYSADPADPREIMVQFWYPAQPTPGATPTPYIEGIDVIGPALAGGVGLPPFFLDHIKLSRTHAVANADVSAAQPSFPVLIFSHGWTGIRALHTSLAQELASHGYIVAGIDHTYGAGVTVFPYGRAVFVNPDALPSGVSDAEYKRAANTLAKVWAADVRFVLDQLAQFNIGDDRFAGRLDLARTGIFGHSMGGGAMLEFCWQDDRCRAGLAMDAWFLPVSDQVMAEGVATPFLFMRSEIWSTNANDALYEKFLTAQQGSTYEITIAGTRHYDFTDAGLLSPFVDALGLKKGPIDAKRGLAIVNAYTLAFFDYYLKGAPTPLLDGPASGYPEVLFRKHLPLRGS